MTSHLATCGSIGMWGRRCGTTYAHTPRAVLGIINQPWFRFRNDECERLCREEWAKPAPKSGDYFDVTDEAEPDCGHSTRTDGELRKCSLARWEREPYAMGWGCHLQRLGDTDFYRWYQKRSDYCWYPVGRLLRINEAGRAIRETEAIMSAVSMFALRIGYAIRERAA